MPEEELKKIESDLEALTEELNKRAKELENLGK